MLLVFEAVKRQSRRAVEGLLCLLLLAGIIVLVILNCALIREKNNLQSRHDNMTGQIDQLQDSFDQLLTSYDNMTEQKDQCETMFDNMTEQKDQCKIMFDNMTEQKDQCEIMFGNMTEQKDQWNTRFDELETRHTNLTELKRILCESHGFTFGDGVCYYISTERKTWEQSRAYCTAKQSDLMIIKSKEKQDLVVKLNQYVWLGLTDRETEGVMKWVDGTLLTTPTYWFSPAEPNDRYGEEDCVEFRYGGWNDQSCSDNNHWICEIVI